MLAAGASLTVWLQHLTDCMCPHCCAAACVLHCCCCCCLCVCVPSCHQQAHWPGSELRLVSGGHVSAFLMHQDAFRGALRDSLARVAGPPPAAAAALAGGGGGGGAEVSAAGQ